MQEIAARKIAIELALEQRIDRCRRNRRLVRALRRNEYRQEIDAGRKTNREHGGMRETQNEPSEHLQPHHPRAATPAPHVARPGKIDRFLAPVTAGNALAGGRKGHIPSRASHSLWRFLLSVIPSGLLQGSGVSSILNPQYGF